MFWLLFFQYITILVFGKIIIQDLKIHSGDLLYLVGCFGVSFALKKFEMLALTFCVVLTGYLLFIVNRNIRLSVVAAIESVLLSVVIDHITEITVRLIHFPQAFIYLFVALGILSGAILFWIYKRRLNSNYEHSISTWELLLSILTLTIVYGYIVVIEKNTTDLYYIFFDLIFFLFFGITNILIQFEHNRMLSQAVEVKHKSELLKSNERYIQEMEKHYNEMRKFRHDYQNIILSLDEYLKTNDIAGLNSYYQQGLKPINTKLNIQKYVLEDISRIKSKEVKSILFNKVSAAQEKSIGVEFECPVQIDEFNIDRIDLIIILGIIIDNAIEAVDKYIKGTLSIALFQSKYEQVIIVKNTFNESLPPLWKLKTRGYSTKGTNRGWGLANLQEIIDGYPNITLETSYLKSVFLQKIIIEMEKSHD